MSSEPEAAVHRDPPAAPGRGTRRALGRLFAGLVASAAGSTAAAEPPVAARRLRPCPGRTTGAGRGSPPADNPCPAGTACAAGYCRPLPNPPCDARSCMKPSYRPKAGGWVCASVCVGVAPRCVAGRCLPALASCAARAGEEPCGGRCCQALLGERCCHASTGAVCCANGRCGRKGCTPQP